MVIDKGTLVALLVEKTGRSKQQVNEQLNQLVNKIRQTADSDSTLKIDGLGTFSSQDGELQFEPDEQLQIEINQKYAGMKPIELMAAFKESGAGIPFEETTPKPVMPEPPADAESDIPEKIDEPEAEPEPTAEVSEEEQEKEKLVAAPVPDTSKEEKKIKKPAEKTAEKTVSGHTKKESNPIVTVLVAAVTVIAILVAGWLLYNSGIFSTSDTGNNLAGTAADTTAQEVVQPSRPAADDSMAAASITPDSAEQNAADDVSNDRSTGRDSTSAAYGLKGSLNEQAQDAYTIVIHSFRFKSTVREIADSLDQKGYRTVLFEGLANENTRWRLGLGQFKTINDAQEAVQRLSAPYKKNHFIRRIQ
jgi:nucleoid DNA-binding protein